MFGDGSLITSTDDDDEWIPCHHVRILYRIILVVHKDGR